MSRFVVVDIIRRRDLDLGLIGGDLKSTAVVDLAPHVVPRLTPGILLVSAGLVLVGDLTLGLGADLVPGGEIGSGHAHLQGVTINIPLESALDIMGKTMVDPGLGVIQTVRFLETALGQ